MLNWRILLLDKALLQHVQISKFEEANEADLEVLRDWLGRKNGGNCTIRGREANPWEDDEYAKDLTSLISQDGEKDCFTLWAKNKFMPRFHKCLGHHMKVPYSVYSISILVSSSPIIGHAKCNLAN